MPFITSRPNEFALEFGHAAYDGLDQFPMGAWIIKRLDVRPSGLNRVQQAQ